MKKNNSGLHVLELELTNKCNLNCIHCYVDKIIPHELSFDTVLDLIRQAKILDVYRLVFTGGEPLLYPKVFTAARYAKKLGIKNLFLLTNGILINKTNVNKLKVFDGIQLSMDNVPNQKSLRENYTNTLENTVLLLQQKKIRINFYCTLCKSNVDNVDQIIKYAKKLNIKIGFNTLVSLNPMTENQKLSPAEIKAALTKIVAYINKGYQVDLSHHLRFLIDTQRMTEFNNLIKDNSNKIYGGCLAGIAALYICNNGDVLACPFLKYPCDNVYKNKLIDIWENNNILNVLRDRKNFEGICGKCKYVNACGGCRAQSYLKYGKINASESGCFLDQKTMTVIRPATIHDAKIITDIKIKTWKDTYKNLIETSYLDTLELTSEVINKWKERIDTTKNNQTSIWVAVESGQVVGFLWGGKARGQLIDDLKSEIYAFYVLPQYQHGGIGTKLFLAFKNKYNQGFFLWMLKGNPSRLFYEKMGCQKTSHYNPLFLGDKQYEEVAYIHWPETY